MTLPVSGPIYFSEVNTELDKSSTASIYLGDAAVRTLAEVPSGPIYMSNLYGKSNRRSISYTFFTTTANASLNLASLPNYAPGAADITITINAGVYLYATSTSNAGLTLTGGVTGDTLAIVNNGFILGMGGSPTNYSNVTTGSGTAAPRTANPGGTALSLSYPATINNTNASAYIAGGGGSGGGAWYWVTGYGGIYSLNSAGGGGAGGGVGGNAYGYDSAGNGVLGATGGSGGGVGSSGSNGAVGTGGTYGQQSGGGGGRVLPATNITNSINTPQQSPATYLAGLGGSGGGTGGIYGNATPAPGGGVNNATASTTGGGGTNSASTSYTSGTIAIGGSGGGWGASGSGGGLNSTSSDPGAVGGKAVSLNGNSVTWISGDTTRVYGAVS